MYDEYRAVSPNAPFIPGKNCIQRGPGRFFTGKVNGDFGTQLLSAFNADNALKKLLLSIDLDSLCIELSDGVVACTLTPYGGGMAYLVIPPVRTSIPLPPEQISPLTRALEKISTHMMH
ncbi:DUF3156 family protein [Vibrio quintilis]|uniref:Uncharacterized protein n=1 Tax=Vibrio quintilis TaxID=1117707 RepID=A0A1M7Z3B9_9VIBR|nr:DUF3156 family protein [Vibrio quintilis]SHO59280.1 hypothetical protein VQ7734_05060 [Vibrio quintilis]